MKFNPFCILLMAALLSGISNQLVAQVLGSGKKENYTRQDTLRGSITPERDWWDVVAYDLTFEPGFSDFSLKGENIISFKPLSPGKRMQIDLQQPMKIDAVLFKGKPLKYTREGNVYFIEFPKSPELDKIHEIKICFSGNPRIAVNPPWDGGLVWRKDEKGRNWLGTACQGLGASVWWPCKDHQSDEAEKATITIISPKDLTGVANGKLKAVKDLPADKKSWTWEVNNPINNYGISINIGAYTHFSDTLHGENGLLPLDYYVMDYNLQKATKQFEQVKPMLRCFENWFGPYPFYSDGFKIVESYYLGMEHQSAIAYGNKWQNGYLGKDLSGTGWGLTWDFIIIHESGHEWFGNNITTKDIADMWIHEGFTNYSETLFTEWILGQKQANQYVQGLRKNIANDKPIIGPYHVNKEGSGDMYYKGANLVHNIRQIINNDARFREMLRELNKSFFQKTTSTAEVEKFISQKAGMDLSKVFDQYLRYKNIPTLEYCFIKGVFNYRWNTDVSGFDMPLRITHNNEEIFIRPVTEWKTLPEKSEVELLIYDKNFYIKTKEICN